MKKEIDYYGNTDNYIHLKFGEARKMYNFTTDFIEKYPDFTREYKKYFQCEPSRFKNPFQIVTYVFENEIPINFYYNFTDEPANDREDIIIYLVKEQSFIGELYKQ
jgi:hypothetical protein